MNIDNIPEKTKNVISEQISQVGKVNTDSDFQKNSELNSVRSRKNIYKFLTIIVLVFLLMGALWVSFNSELMYKIDEWIRTVK